MLIRNSHRAMGIILAATVAASPAWSQNTKPAEPAKPAQPSAPPAPTRNTDPAAPPPTAKPADPADPNGVLSGPKVNEEPGAPGNGRPRRDGQGGKGDERGRRPADGLFFRAVHELQLTPDQSTKIDVIAEEFRTAVKQFEEQYGPQIRELRKKNAESGDTPKRDPAMMQENQKLQSLRPKAEPYQDRVWALLDDAQKATVTKRVDEMRKLLEERRAAQRGDAPGDPNMNRGPASKRPGAGPDHKAPPPDENARRRHEFLKSHQAHPAPPAAPAPPAPPAPPTP